MGHIITNPLTHEEMDDRTQFVIIKGRYYAFMFFIKLPCHLSRFGKGGDINGLLWKLDEEPDKWTFQFRFRQYLDSQAFDSNDEKTWYAVEITAGDETTARDKAEEAIRLMVEGAGVGFNAELTVERLEIKGDNDKFAQAVEEQKPSWMHTQQMVQE